MSDRTGGDETAKSASAQEPGNTSGGNVIIHGDSAEVLKTFDSNSIDLLCTDPPYALVPNKPTRGGVTQDASSGFMNAAWDGEVPSVEIWKECWRVLKPGAFAFVMSAPRADCQYKMIGNIAEAGFNVGFTPIYFTFASGFPKAMNIGKMVDKRNGTARIEYDAPIAFPDSDTWGTPNSNKGSTTTIWKGGNGKELGKGGTVKRSKGFSPLEGSYGGFQPKPAVEVIIVAMKPLSEKTYVDQALKNGKGITWLDDGRIPADTPSKKWETPRGGIWQTDPEAKSELVDEQRGRFPANLLVSDDVLNDGREWKGKPGINKKMSSGFGQDYREEHATHSQAGMDDKGSFSRYFSLDAWAAKLPEHVQKTFPFLLVPKASKREKTANGTIECKHPTVKSLQLISYLITLGSRPGDTVLDPFAGSFTTCCAAKALGRNSIGIEREAEYVEIGRARVAAVPEPMA